MGIIRISGIRMPVRHKRPEVLEKCIKKAGISREKISGWEVRRVSIDARKKPDVYYMYTVDIFTEGSPRVRAGEYINPPAPYNPLINPIPGSIVPEPVAVIGAGPAGLFAAYILALNGRRPILIERGKPAGERAADIEAFWNSGEAPDPDSNVLFGEGGAGTFSDGKLTTGIKDRSGRIGFILKTLVRHGAPEDILYMGLPHIGTDILRDVVSSMRECIRENGGSVFFETRADDFIIKDGGLAGIVLTDTRSKSQAVLATKRVILAPGHSARDTFWRLHALGVPMERKPFAVGMRIEHPQEAINRSQYGDCRDLEFLPPSPYKLTYRAKSGRSVYTFCMCPGGFVVDASSEPGMICINGMSTRARDSGNANSAVVVSVGENDFNGSGPLAGVEFQRELERRAYAAGEGCVPQERLGNFLGETGDFDTFKSCHKGQARQADLRGILPKYAENAFLEAIGSFGKKIAGFDAPQSILSAVETRTSSPVRILRDENFESPVHGIYPCGEGAGYAGGIVSSAVDGLRVAEAVLIRD